MRSAEDAIGLARFREKYAPLMSGEADKIAFDIASKPRRGQQRRLRRDRQDGGERRYARRLPARDEARFPDATARAPAADPNPTGSLPPITAGVRRAGG